VADKADLGREVRRDGVRGEAGGRAAAAAAANGGRGGRAAKEREEGARTGRALPPFLAGPLVFANCLGDVSLRHPSPSPSP